MKTGKRHQARSNSKKAKVLCFALCAMLFVLCSTAKAQQATKVFRIGYLSPFDPARESTRAEAIRLALRERGYIEGQNIAFEYRVDDLERVFAALNKERPDGLYVAGGGQNVCYRKRIAGFALKSRLPSTYNNKEAVEVGGLMSYGADLADSYRRVAYFVDRILKGAKPADLPVEQPTKFELVINLKTAKQIGLAIPPEVLARATKLIK
jgi:ABC-type uncharacterized transport system substrate-binding protein